MQPANEPQNSESPAAPADDPEWVKGVVAKALLHAANDDLPPLAPTPRGRVAAEWPEMQTEVQPREPAAPQDTPIATTSPTATTAPTVAPATDASVEIPLLSSPPATLTRPTPSLDEPRPTSDPEAPLATTPTTAAPAPLPPTRVAPSTPVAPATPSTPATPTSQPTAATPVLLSLIHI